MCLNRRKSCSAWNVRFVCVQAVLYTHTMSVCLQPCVHVVWVGLSCHARGRKKGVSKQAPCLGSDNEGIVQKQARRSRQPKPAQFDRSDLMKRLSEGATAKGEKCKESKAAKAKERALCQTWKLVAPITLLACQAPHDGSSLRVRATTGSRASI